MIRRSHQAWARDLVETEAQAVIAMLWPKPEMAGVGVLADEAPRTRIEIQNPQRRGEHFGFAWEAGEAIRWRRAGYRG